MNATMVDFCASFLSLHELPNKVRSQEGALCGGEGGER